MRGQRDREARPRGARRTGLCAFVLFLLAPGIASPRAHASPFIPPETSAINVSLEDPSPPAVEEAQPQWTDGEAADEPLAPAAGGYGYPDDFPLPASLKSNVDFWKRIYGEYTGSHVLFHDTEHMDILYGYVDFSELEQRAIPEAQRRRLRSDECARTERWIQGILRDLSSGGHAAREKSEHHARIASLFGPRARSSDFYQASHEDRIRGQTGLKDRFLEGIVLAGRTLPWIERAFLEEGLPVELSRLPFVESMFVNHARSRAGAVGMWQFMLSTGRRYLLINAAVDERLDPVLAARGAARLLADNYRVLGNWPLALTAYNHGRAGMARAVESLGTRDLGIIAEQYRSRTFGFASRNFYSEFLAAMWTYENRHDVFGPVRSDPPLAFDEIALDAYVAAGTLARHAGIATADLKALNPAVSDHVWQGRIDLPAGYRLRIPQGREQAFLAAWGRIPAADKRSGQRGPAYAYHRVKRGETLGGIARKYGTNAEALRELNGLKSARSLQAGARIRVPARGGGAVVASGAGEAPARSSSSSAPSGSYTVRPGDTPGEIARRFGMTAGELMRANGIPNARSLRVGQVLKVGESGPAAPATRQHVVRSGDSLSKIAQAYGTSVRALQAENRLGRSGLIRPGQTLTIPE